MLQVVIICLETYQHHNHDIVVNAILAQAIPSSDDVHNNAD